MSLTPLTSSVEIHEEVCNFAIISLTAPKGQLFHSYMSLKEILPNHRQALQEAEYAQKGAYHRRMSFLPCSPGSLLYRFAGCDLPNDLKGAISLDFGGGDGAFASNLADRGAAVVVFDSSRVALTYAQVDNRLGLCQGRTNLPFVNSAFKVVAMLEVLEHIPDEEEMLALQETRRVLVPGGWLVISVPSSRLPVAEKHYRHYSWKDLTKKLESVGLKVEKAIFYKTLLASLNNWHWLVRRPLKGAAYVVDWTIRDIFGRNGLVECSSPEEADGFVVLASSP